MIGFLLDQGLPPLAAALLRKRGVQSTHVRELEMHDAEDAQILAFAAASSWIVVTLDRDFPELLARTAALGPSVVFIRKQHLKASELASLLESIAFEYAGVLLAGCVLKVADRGIRARQLPLN